MLKKKKNAGGEKGIEEEREKIMYTSSYVVSKASLEVGNCREKSEGLTRIKVKEK